MEERKRHKELAEQTKNMRKEKREAERKQREEERQRIELEKERLQEKKLHKANQAKINFMKYFGKSVPIKKVRIYFDWSMCDPSILNEPCGAA